MHSSTSIFACARKGVGQRRRIWDWVALHPEITTLSVVAAAAAARALQLELRTRTQAVVAAQQSKREQDLHNVRAQLDAELKASMKREKQLELRVQAQASHASERAKRELELHKAKATADAELREAREREIRLQSSIVARGRLGEHGLHQLLAEARAQGFLESYQMQPEIAHGKRPDAVVELKGGACLVVDSKAPQPPNDLLQTNCDDARRIEYVNTLKQHIRNLSYKRYHAELPQGSLTRTWVLLPGEGYLQAAYAPDGTDSLGLHAYAAKRGVMLVGPNGLRSTLHLVELLQSEQQAKDRLAEGEVQQRLLYLQPAWTENVLPRTRAMGRDLKKLVTTFNELGEVITTFDTDLRAKDAFDLPKPRKTSLPPKVVGPAHPHAEEIDTDEMLLTLPQSPSESIAPGV